MCHVVSVWVREWGRDCKDWFGDRDRVTIIPITCLRQGKIFRRGGCVTRILITFLRRGKNFRRGTFEFSTCRAYFSHYSLIALTNTIIRNASVLQIHKLVVHPPTPKYTLKNFSLPRPNAIQSKYIPHPQAYSVKRFSDMYLGVGNIFCVFTPERSEVNTPIIAQSKNYVCICVCVSSKSCLYLLTNILVNLRPFPQKLHLRVVRFLGRFHRWKYKKSVTQLYSNLFMLILYSLY